MKPEPGTYALMLRSVARAEISIGRWGLLGVEPGYYIYVGSAFGPGGVRARVARHFREAKRNHWHIDYLREVVEPIGAWCSYEPLRLEHEWARALGQRTGFTGIKRFGCSDCACNGHLFFMTRRPDDAEIVSVLGGSVEAWPHPIGRFRMRVRQVSADRR